jgi:hypothetical protein
MWGHTRRDLRRSTRWCCRRCRPRAGWTCRWSRKAPTSSASRPAMPTEQSRRPSRPGRAACAAAGVRSFEEDDAEARRRRTRMLGAGDAGRDDSESVMSQSIVRALSADGPRSRSGPPEVMSAARRRCADRTRFRFVFPWWCKYSPISVPPPPFRRRFPAPTARRHLIRARATRHL